MKSKLLATVIFTLFFTGCATVNKRNAASTINHTSQGQKLSLTYEINKELSSEHFGLIELNFKNPSDKWVDIKNVELIIRDEYLANAVKLTSGLEFDNWRKAMRKKVAISNQNTSVLVSGLLLASAAVASDSNKSANTIGTLGVTAAIGSQTVRQISSDINQVEANSLFPQAHILTAPEKVPPSLFLDKWLLVDTSEVAPNMFLRELELKVTYQDASEDLYAINVIRYKDGRKVNDWQKEKIKSIKKR